MITCFSDEFSFFTKFFGVPQFRGTEFCFSAPIVEEKWTREKYLFTFLTGQKYNKKLKFLSFWCYSSGKTDMIQVFRSIIAFSEMKFENIAGKLSFRCTSAESWENLYFLKDWNAILVNNLCVFITFWIRSHK